jgi:hypothetical protein
MALNLYKCKEEKAGNKKETRDRGDCYMLTISQLSHGDSKTLRIDPLVSVLLVLTVDFEGKGDPSRIEYREGVYYWFSPLPTDTASSISLPLW